MLILWVWYKCVLFLRERGAEYRASHECLVVSLLGRLSSNCCCKTPYNKRLILTCSCDRGAGPLPRVSWSGAGPGEAAGGWGGEPRQGLWSGARVQSHGGSVLRVHRQRVHLQAVSLRQGLHTLMTNNTLLLTAHVCTLGVMRVIHLLYTYKIVCHIVCCISHVRWNLNFTSTNATALCNLLCQPYK